MLTGVRRNLTVMSDDRWAVAAFVSASGLVIVTMWLSSVLLPHAEAGLEPRVRVGTADAVLAPTMYWDGAFYNTLASAGYPPADVATFDEGGEAMVAFFPGYPAVARLVSSIVGDVALSQIVVTILCGIGFSVLFLRWAREQLGSPSAARLALLALLTYPWAFFLMGVGYSESLFLFAVLGSFMLLDRGHPMIAGLIGALASATRVVGIAVIVGLALRTYEVHRTRAEPRRSKPGWKLTDAWVALSAAGVLAFMAFCWSRYGDPLAFASAQGGWGSPPGPRSWFKLTFIDVVRYIDDTWFVVRLALQGVVGIGFCLAIPAVWRRFGATWGTYTTVVLAVPMIGSSVFASMGRHALAAFPVFALAGERLSMMPRRHAVTYLSASAGLMLAWASLWGRGYWMG